MYRVSRLHIYENEKYTLHNVNCIHELIKNDEAYPETIKDCEDVREAIKIAEKYMLLHVNKSDLNMTNIGSFLEMLHTYAHKCRRGDDLEPLILSRTSLFGGDWDDPQSDYRLVIEPIKLF